MPSARAVTWNASRSSDRSGIRRAYLLMPDNNRTKSYLALDLGAESGRAILARLHSGVLTTKEIRRFKNEPVEYGGSLHWDVTRLWWEVRSALRSLEETELAGIGVDAWGVDYALLGEHGELLQNPYHYRDARTNGVMQEVFGKFAKEEIYAATGIQFMPINTLYQLYSAMRHAPALLKAAERLVMIPDLFHYWLTGNAVCEFTNATTTQLVNPATRTWATELISRLELPRHLLTEIVEPGTQVGTLLPSISRDSSLSPTPVIAPATHDTGSTVAAISAREGTAFLSSGTWSLLGTELDAPVISPEAFRFNFTNEGGVNGTTRLLKNVMGLWMLQCCRQSWTAQGQSCDHLELMELAAREDSLLSRGSGPCVFFTYVRYAGRDRSILCENSSAFAEKRGRLRPGNPGESGFQISPRASQPRAAYRKANPPNSRDWRRIEKPLAQSNDRGCYGKKTTGRAGRSDCPWKCRDPNPGDRRRQLVKGSPPNYRSIVSSR